MLALNEETQTERQGQIGEEVAEEEQDVAPTWSRHKHQTNIKVITLCIILFFVFLLAGLTTIFIKWETNK